MNTIKIKNNDNYETVNLIELERDELVLLRINTQADMDTIKEQIAEYNESSTQYKHLNKDWWIAAKKALRHKKLDIAKIQAQLTSLKKDQSIQHFFIRAAKDILPAVQYQQLLDAAKERQRLN